MKSLTKITKCVLSISLILLIPLLSSFNNIQAQTQPTDSDLTTNAPVIEFYMAQLTDCNRLTDTYLELYPTAIQHASTGEITTVETIKVTSLNDPSQSIRMTRAEGFQGEFYGLKVTEQDPFIRFKLEAYDRFNRAVITTKIEKSSRKAGNVEVPESFMDLIMNMGHDLQDPSLNANYLNPKMFDMFTYFCGKKVSKVMLLSFFQDFLGLSEAEICEIKQLFAQSQIDYNVNQIVTWSKKYCDLLNEFWDAFITWNGGGNSGSGGEDDCECKVINTSVFVNHSIGASTGTALEDCPDVSVRQGYEIWAEGAGPGHGTDNDQNWLITKWARMGAAKSLYTISHNYKGGDEGRNMEWSFSPSVLRSSITLSMKCFDPHSAEIDTSCVCEKDVIAGAQYTSRIRGYSGTDGNITGSGNGEVRTCMEDFAFLTRFTREGFDVIESGAASTCTQCNSEDSTNFFTDLGTLAGGIGGVAPTFTDTSLNVLGQIESFFNTGGAVIDIVDNFLQSLIDCGDYRDTTYTQFFTGDNYTLTPENDYINYTVYSYALTKTDYTNDEAFAEMHLISDYYLAAGLESSGDSTCCQEKVGGYLIGHLGDFESDFTPFMEGNDEDDFTFENDFHLKIKDPIQDDGVWLDDEDLFQATPTDELAILQTNIAEMFFAIHPDFLKDVFGIDCGPGCTGQVDCYYNCGFYGDCHETPDPFNGNMSHSHTTLSNHSNKAIIPNMNMIPSNDITMSPNPISDGQNLDIKIDKVNDYQELYILSADGKVINKQTINSPNLIIESKNLSKGLNMIVIRKTDGSVYVDKIVKE